MKNLTVGEAERRDICSQVDKVLRGLGYPDPPLMLDDVRALLELDRQYYTSTDDGALREFVSRVKVGSKQFFLRPGLIIDVIKKANLAALWLPDRKRILIDSSHPIIKHRWYEAHEIAHSQLPWHQSFNLGDSQSELSLSCREQIEAEANFGAGQLLFLMSKFKEVARSYPVSLASAMRLAKDFDNSMTSTLWRYAEEACDDLPVVGIVSSHPFHRAPEFDPKEPCRHSIESPTFKKRFGTVTELDLFSGICGYCSFKRTGPLGKGDVILSDVNGDAHVFHFESFATKYYVLSLAVHVRKLAPVVAL